MCVCVCHHTSLSLYIRLHSYTCSGVIHSRESPESFNLARATRSRTSAGRVMCVAALATLPPPAWNELHAQHPVSKSGHHRKPYRNPPTCVTATLYKLIYARSHMYTAASAQQPSSTSSSSRTSSTNSAWRPARPAQRTRTYTVFFGVPLGYILARHSSYMMRGRQGAGGCRWGLLSMYVSVCVCSCVRKSYLAVWLAASGRTCPKY